MPGSGKGGSKHGSLEEGGERVIFLFFCGKWQEAPGTIRDFIPGLDGGRDGRGDIFFLSFYRYNICRSLGFVGVFTGRRG